MHILVTAATKIELQVLKPHMRQMKIPWVSIDFVTTGIGNSETLYALTRSIETKWVPDLIINIGIAGYAGGSIKKGFIYQVSRVIQGHTGKERVLQIHLPDLPLATCVSSDIPLTDTDLIHGCDLVDMESWSICWIAEKYDISKILLKIPYDRVGEETKKFHPKECEDFLVPLDTSDVMSHIETCIRANVNFSGKDFENTLLT